LKLIIYFIGVTKCFGEALGRYMGEHEELPTIVVRIGAYQPHTSLKDDNKTGLIMNAWLSEPDAVQLFERCIEAPPNLKFAIVHGLSGNIFNRMDINSTRQLLNYDPQDNFFDAHDTFKPLNITKSLLAHNVEYV
jgi:uronate dehydrogenase